MAQANGDSTPPLGGRSSPVHKRAREESAHDVGDCDEEVHCPAPKMDENREAAISMLPGLDLTKDQPCHGCRKYLPRVSEAAVGKYWLQLLPQRTGRQVSFVLFFMLCAFFEKIWVGFNFNFITHAYH